MKTQFFTGKGDGGKSSFGNKRLEKDDALFELLGNLDELNSWFGLCRIEAEKVFARKKTGAIVVQSLEDLQEDLFIAQAEIASIGFAYSVKKIPRITEAKTAQLENMIQKIDALLPTLRNFVLPGGSELSARLDVARAIARRTERSAVVYGKRVPLSPDFLQFLNRLSSMLFALARYTNHALKAKEAHPKYK